MLRSSAIYSGLTLVSRLLGFGRDLVVTAVMGASTSVAADAWYTALAFPNLFRRFFAEGAFAAAFVPAYSRSLAQGRRGGGRHPGRRRHGHAGRRHHRADAGRPS